MKLLSGNHKKKLENEDEDTGGDDVIQVHEIIRVFIINEISRTPYRTSSAYTWLLLETCVVGAAIPKKYDIGDMARDATGAQAI